MRERLIPFLYATSKVMLTVAIAINVLAFIGKVAVTGSLGSGLVAVVAWFNPRNTLNFVGEVVLFSPAVFAYLLADYLQRT